MRKFLIETSVIVNYLRGKSEAVEFINNLEGELTASFVSLAELYEGVFRVKNPRKLEKGILTFFSGLSEVYGLDSEISKEFGKVRACLKRQGEVIEDLDIFLAATCTSHNLAIVTSNPKHFKRVKGLEILEV